MSYLSRFKNIKAFVFDVDGVFTDGSVYLLPDKSMSRVMTRTVVGIGSNLSWEFSEQCGLQAQARIETHFDGW